MFVMKCSVFMFSMSSNTSLNGSDDALVECSDNVGSDSYLLPNDDPLLDDEEQAASDSLEDLNEADPDTNKPRPCLSRAGVIVVGAAVVGVFVVIGVIVVVILSVLSLHSSSKIGHRAAANTAAVTTSILPSVTFPHSKPVVVELTLRENCTTRIVGSINDGVRSFKVCNRLIDFDCFFSVRSEQVGFSFPSNT